MADGVLKPMNMEMVCTCGADGVREVEERRLRIFRRMRLENMENLTEAVVLSLAFDFSCDANVYVDMWFGIAFETPLLPDEKLFLPCDGPHDGFAAIWEMLSERFPERVTAAPGKIRWVPRSGSRSLSSSGTWRPIAPTASTVAPRTPARTIARRARTATSFSPSWSRPTMPSMWSGEAGRSMLASKRRSATDSCDDATTATTIASRAGA